MLLESSQLSKIMQKRDRKKKTLIESLLLSIVVCAFFDEATSPISEHVN